MRRELKKAKMAFFNKPLKAFTKPYPQHQIQSTQSAVLDIQTLAVA